MRIAIIALATSAVFVLACGGAKPEPDLDATAGPEIVIPDREPYRLAVGDLIRIDFFYYPEYDVTLAVRPDGAITVPLVGEVVVEGMKPTDLEEIVRQRYSEVIAEPEVSVIVMEFADQRVFVFGEVGSPGSFSLQGAMTLVDAIADAGGILDSGQAKSVILMRRDETGRYAGRSINVKAFLESEESEAIYLMPRDIIYVPMTTIARVDVFVDQFFTKLSPAWLFYIYGTRALKTEGDFSIGL